MVCRLYFYGSQDVRYLLRLSVGFCLNVVVECKVPMLWQNCQNLILCAITFNPWTCLFLCDLWVYSLQWFIDLILIAFLVSLYSDLPPYLNRGDEIFTLV